MSGGSNYLDPNRPDAVRLSVSDARVLGEAALDRIGYGGDDARIITDQLIDNSLCGYRFAGLPRILAIAREAKTKNARVPVAIVHETPVSALVSSQRAFRERERRRAEGILVDGAVIAALRVL